MPASPTSITSRLLAAYPQILTTDFDNARSFYCDQLGFSIVYEYGQPAFYALLGRGEARLNLRFVHEHPMDLDLAAAEEVLAAYIPVRGVKELYEEHKDTRSYVRLIAEGMPGNWKPGTIKTQLLKLGLTGSQV